MHVLWGAKLRCISKCETAATGCVLCACVSKFVFYFSEWIHLSLSLLSKRTKLIWQNWDVRHLIWPFHILEIHSSSVEMSVLTVMFIAAVMAGLAGVELCFVLVYIRLCVVVYAIRVCTPVPNKPVLYWPLAYLYMCSWSYRHVALIAILLTVQFLSFTFSKCKSWFNI